MDGPLTLVTSSAGMPWPETGDQVAGEDSPAVLAISSRWPPNSATTAQMSAVPLSPISTEHDIACVVVDSSATVPPALRSAASSDTTWDTYQDDGPVGNANDDMNWEHSADDGSGSGSAVLKIELVDDDSFCMEDVQEAPRTTSVPRSDRVSSGQPKTKRPRGRPRKHPLTSQVANSKVTKGRSKTGCITCRKRKKKCDEAKPRCENGLWHISEMPPLISSRPELREERSAMRRVPRENSLEEWQRKERRR